MSLDPTALAHESNQQPEFYTVGMFVRVCTRPKTKQCVTIERRKEKQQEDDGRVKSACKNSNRAGHSNYF